MAGSQSLPGDAEIEATQATKIPAARDEICFGIEKWLNYSKIIFTSYKIKK